MARAEDMVERTVDCDPRGMLDGEWWKYCRRLMVACGITPQTDEEANREARADGSALSL